MIVAVDANVLVAWSAAKRGDDVARLDFLFDTVSKASGRILVPTPSLAEFLVRANDAALAWMNILERKRSVLLAPFDRRAAFECALYDRGALGGGDKKRGSAEPWQKIKIDRQIVSIARTNNADRIVSDDDGVRAAALQIGMLAYRLSDLDLPDSAKQHELNFKAAPEVPEVPPADSERSAPGALPPPSPPG